MCVCVQSRCSVCTCVERVCTMHIARPFGGCMQHPGPHRGWDAQLEGCEQRGQWGAGVHEHAEPQPGGRELSVHRPGAGGCRWVCVHMWESVCAHVHGGVHTQVRGLGGGSGRRQRWVRAQAAVGRGAGSGAAAAGLWQGAGVGGSCRVARGIYGCGRVGSLPACLLACWVGAPRWMAPSPAPPSRSPGRLCQAQQTDGSFLPALLASELI